jgi:hypothetical protein
LEEIETMKLFGAPPVREKQRNKNRTKKCQLQYGSKFREPRRKNPFELQCLGFNMYNMFVYIVE